jgi:hypothetical protein
VVREVKFTAQLPGNVGMMKGSAFLRACKAGHPADLPVTNARGEGRKSPLPPLKLALKRSPEAASCPLTVAEEYHPWWSTYWFVFS